MKYLWQALMMVRRCDKGSFWRRIVYVILQSLLPLLNLYVLKLLVDGVTAWVASGTVGNGYLTYIVVMAVVFLLNRVVGALSGVNNDVLTQKLTDYVSDLMQRQAARLDMAYYDTPEYHDTYHRAQQEASSRPIMVLNNFMALFGSVLSLAGVVAMLLSAQSWWVIAVMLLAVVPSFLVRLYKARSIYAFRRGATQLYRQTGYYNALLTAREPAKEVRAFGLAPVFRRRFVESRATLVERLLHISRRLGALDIVCGVVEALALLLVVYVLCRDAGTGAVTIGTFVMLFEAFRRGQGYMQNLVGGIAGLYDNRLFAGNLFEFLNLEPRVVNVPDPLPVPSAIESVEFRDITFRYPDMDRNVLEHFNLVAYRGSVTRIDGENGFGKSTLVKLLMRFYDPDEGQVLLNGVDLRRYDLSQLRRSVGALFQDFIRYNCTVAENIGFGRVGETLNRNRMEDAARLAGFDVVVANLPQGYDTLLGRLFDGGAELSMGQWQRLALARLFYSEAPVMVMDEPLAWMDQPTRLHFNQSVEQLRHDRIIIMITHA